MLFLLPSCKFIIMQHWKAYFIFSEKEQKGILVLGFVLIASVLLHIVFPGKLKTTQQKKSAKMVTNKLFYFDPNTIDSVSATQLGLSSKQFSTLQNYRNKGGRFRQASDIFKLYGLPNEIAKVLLPFVRIVAFNRITPVYNTYTNKTYHTNYNSSNSTWKIDMNSDLVGEWKLLVSLDSILIGRILKYKKHIGYYSHQSQLLKVYGMTDSIYQILKPHLMIAKQRTPALINSSLKLNSSTMNFEAWKSLGIFQEREIWRILHMRKANGGVIGWRMLVLEFDLSSDQTQTLRQKLIIND